MTFLMYLLVIGSAFFVYYDATKNNIGKISGEKGFLNMSPLGWAIATLLIWIIAFPLYLYKRSTLIVRAKNNPIKVSAVQRKIVMGLLSLLFLAVLVNGISLINNNVSIVKNGILDFDKSLTVGQAFDNYKYFKDVEWESFTSENGRKVVEVNAKLDFSKYPDSEALKKQEVKNITIFFQFLINQDLESFQIHTYGMEFEMNDGTKKTVDAKDLNLNQYNILNNLQEIYNNQPLS